MPGPDFPTGGIICGRSGIRRGYHTGRGTIVVRARARIEEYGKNRYRIVVTEIPYQQARDRVEERIAAAGRTRTGSRASPAIRNESDLKEPVRLVVELKRDADPDVVLNQLYQFSPLQDIVLAHLPGAGRRQAADAVAQGDAGGVHPASRDGHSPPHAVPAGQGPAAEAHGRRPAAGARQYRRGDPRHPRVGDAGRGQGAADGRSKRPAAHDAAGAGRRGLRACSRRSAAWPRPTRSPPVQADAILRMTLGQLVNLEQEKLGERASRAARRRSPSTCGSSPTSRTSCGIIRDDCSRAEAQARRRAPHRDQRRGDRRDRPGRPDHRRDDGRHDQPPGLHQAHAGQHLPRPAPRRQGDEGGQDRGRRSDRAPVRRQHARLPAVLHQPGKVYWQKVYDLPQLARESRGRAVVNLLNLAEGEKIADCRAVRDFDQPDHFLMMATRSGLVKKTDAGGSTAGR